MKILTSIWLPAQETLSSDAPGRLSATTDLGRTLFRYSGSQYWSFHNLGDISLFTMKVMFYILWYAPGWEDITAQYIGRDALSCYRSAPSRKRCRGDREAARCTLGQCITLAYKMAPGWREGS